MYSLPYPSAFHPYAIQSLQTTTSPPVSIPVLPGDMDSVEALLAFATTLANGAEGLKHPSVPSTPDVTDDSGFIEAKEPATSPPTLSPTSPAVTIAEVFNQKPKMTISLNKAVLSLPKARTPRETRIKRPMNAFMVWSQARRMEISRAGLKYHNSDISKMLGAEWRGMADDLKIPFVHQAKVLREQHLKKYPDYVYRPRRRKRVEKSSGSVDSSTDEAVSPSAVNFLNNVFSTIISQLVAQQKNNQLENESPPPNDS